jgi:hypothetical protein
MDALLVNGCPSLPGRLIVCPVATRHLPEEKSGSPADESRLLPAYSVTIIRLHKTKVNTMNKFVRFLPVVAAVALIASPVERKGSFDITEFAGKTTKYPVVALEKKGSFDITEMKFGFDERAGGTSKGGDVPVTPGLMAGGTSKGEEVPVTPGLTAGGTSKGGEVPVVPGLRAGGGGGTGEVIIISG